MRRKIYWEQIEMEEKSRQQKEVDELVEDLVELENKILDPDFDHYLPETEEIVVDNERFKFRN